MSGTEEEASLATVSSEIEAAVAELRVFAGRSLLWPPVRQGDAACEVVIVSVTGDAGLGLTGGVLAVPAAVAPDAAAVEVPMDPATAAAAEEGLAGRTCQVVFRMVSEDEIAVLDEVSPAGCDTVFFDGEAGSWVPRLDALVAAAPRPSHWAEALFVEAGDPGRGYDRGGELTEGYVTGAEPPLPPGLVIREGAPPAVPPAAEAAAGGPPPFALADGALAEAQAADGGEGPPPGRGRAGRGGRGAARGGAARPAPKASARASSGRAASAGAAGAAETANLLRELTAEVRASRVAQEHLSHRIAALETTRAPPAEPSGLTAMAQRLLGRGTTPPPAVAPSSAPVAQLVPFADSGLLLGPSARRAASPERAPALRRPPAGGSGRGGSDGEVAARRARVLLPGEAAAGPAATAALGSAMNEARAALGASVADRAPPEGTPRNNPERPGDTALREMVQRGGASADRALQVAMLDALERISGRSGRTAGSPASDDVTLDDLLFGGGGGDLDGALRGLQSRGAGSLLRLGQAITREPEKWIEHCNLAAEKALGADVTGQPWSMEAYGRQVLKFGRLVEHERMWCLLASLHTLHRRGPSAFSLMGAKIGQYLKAVETSVACGGNWEMAWLYTDLPEPRPRGRPGRGLAHPTEFAAGVSYLREMRALEDALRGTAALSPAGSGDAGHEAQGDDAAGSGSPKKTRRQRKAAAAEGDG